VGQEFQLETDRLKLLPLSLDDLLLEIRNPRLLAERLGVAPPMVAPGEEFREILRGVAAEMSGDIGRTGPGADGPAWPLRWVIVGKEDGRIIGGFIWKGRPDAHGKVEIGYGLDEPYRGRGYMTEALREVAGWALRQPHVVAVLAETEKGNTASHRVLAKAGFTRFAETEDFYWWRRLRGQANA